MARYTGPVCKLCRREGMPLYLKGTRCFNKEKCAIEKRKNPPGTIPKRKPKMSEYAVQLREKQKVKRFYGVFEKQFRDYYEKASHMTGITGELLLQFLERRLDNVMYRMGFASSRAQARAMISQGHVDVNGRRVNIPSYLVHVGDQVSLREKMQKAPVMEENIKFAQSLNRLPSWLSADYTTFGGEILEMPQREHVDLPVKEQVIVELYSK